MSKTVRKQLLNSIEWMNRAALQIAEVGEINRPYLLQALQEHAVALGTRIEALKGLDTQSVPVLEEICEAIYETSMADAQSCGDAIAHLLALITNLREVFAEEFPDLTEVVFLPYNLAMWDSLESVWRKYASDPQVECHVIPIPYYEKDPQGNYKDVHYDGPDYPKDVPVEDYREYDLRLHHPDMIFIHNPYDQCNHVTTVPTEYFSCYIKDYTEKLIYIPYFVLNEIDPQNQKAIDGMKHFCYTPGTIFADEVWLQSENMRQIYIKEYAIAAVMHGREINPQELYRRFVAYGSPKYDKLFEARERALRDELEIPDDWKPVLYREDGTKRKTVLYNISLSAMLQHSDKMLDKIRRVLQTFYENREDIALLWRPHPLYLQTIESMQPELRDGYLQIVNRYREEKWGIYDESAELDRALVVADAYYGDQSSLVALCKEIKIPIMLEDIEV